MRALAVAVLTLPLALACHSAGSGASGSSSAAPSSSSVSPPRPPASASAAPRAAKPVKGCRVLGSTGEVKRSGGPPVLSGQTLEGSEWLELANAAKVSLRHVASAREWTLLGPAKVRPCLDGEEQLALSSGRVKTSVGAGARPGAEVFVFTPFGTVRYGDATLTVTSEPARLSLALDAGEAWLEPTGESPASKSSERVAAPRPEAKKVGRTEVIATKPNRALLEQRCAEDAQAAADAARDMTLSAPDGKLDLSKKAVAHLKARRRARVACGEALAYAARLDGDERGRLLDRLAELDRIWRAFPKAPAPERP